MRLSILRVDFVVVVVLLLSVAPIVGFGVGSMFCGVVLGIFYS